jgi:uncharacterized protein YukE
MGSNSIKIDTASLAGNLGEFQAQMASMQKLMGSIKSATSGIKGSWQGNSSDIVLGAIEQFQEVFQSIEEQNKKYVTFLNSVIDSYTEADNSQVSAMESNSGSFSVDG